MAVTNFDFGAHTTHYFEYHSTSKRTKKLVIYTKNRPRTIEVTLGKENLNQVQVFTKSGREMWVNKKELF
jgi:hypothetical protein